ncbi:MAG TPA: hypothetical protein VKK31_06235 [Thermoanaerobaculia bacterium]|nr:hypothetical protein [Thermoanaerobaculia bacterium]
MKQAPSDHLFVIDVRHDLESAVERLASLGSVKPLEGSEGLLLLSIPADAGDPETRWVRAQELLGELGTVQPVLLDELGEAHFPTGEISVRFHEAPPDDRLQEFAAEHGLRLRDRNEFVPQQAVFRPASPSASYLPKLVQELAGTKDTQKVWANTLTRFRRAGT